MASNVARVWDIDELVADMRPPTEDDVPISVEGDLLDTPEKVLAHLNRINEERDRLGDRAS